MATQTKQTGFSLIELLVVVTVIAILIGLLLPAIMMVRRSARTVVCAGNLRQIGLAAASYSDDHHGMVVRSALGTSSGSDFMPREFWHGYLGPYAEASEAGDQSIYSLRQHRTVLWGCPEHAHAPDRPWYTGYGINAWLYEPHKAPNWSQYTNAWMGAVWTGNWQLGTFTEFYVDAVTNPSQRPLIGDADTDWTLGYRDEPENRHPSGRNVLFCDGHVSSVPSADLRSLIHP